MPEPVRFQVFDVAEDDTLTVKSDAEVVVGRRDLLGDSTWPHDEAANGKAAAGAARDEFYEVSLPASSGRLNTTLDLTKRNIAQFAVGTVITRYDIKGNASGFASYIGLSAQELPIEVLGAPPGAEANMGSIRGTRHSHQTMKVMTPPRGANIVVVRYFEREFGDDFVQNDLGYASYTKLLSAPLPDPEWSTQRYAFFTDWELGRILRLPSGLVVQRENKNGQCDRPEPHAEGVEQGHLYVMRRARPRFVANMQYLDGHIRKMLLTKDDPAMDIAFFVTNSGKTLLRIRENNEPDFKVPTKPLSLVEMELIHDPFWQPKEPLDVTPLPIGEVETVTPRWFW